MRGAAGEHDTRAALLEVARLRAERAGLLGYEHHAAYIAEDGTAATSAAVAAMLGPLGPAAAANARREAADLERALQADEPGARLEAADWQFYAERVRQERYALDDARLRPYLELERVLREGVFRAANELYGLSFTERPDLHGYHPAVRVFEVHDADGSPMGLFLGDFWTRESKRGGAWMNNLVDQNHLLDEKPVVVNNLNIPRPPAGEPTLLTWDEVITLFHEFGHALHGLLSDVRLPSQSGTEVPRDAVEFPSQVNEMWAWEPSILAHYAVHHATGEPIPSEWIDALLASRQFNEGFGTTEYLAAALLDQAWHRLTPEQVPTEVDAVEAFERAALEAAQVQLDVVPPRYRSTYFNHVFGGGYDAAYYAYLWSEVLDAETVEWFRENGGLSRANGDRFRSSLLSRGGSLDFMEAFRDLRGRDPEIGPLLVRRGLGLAGAPGAGGRFLPALGVPGPTGSVGGMSLDAALPAATAAPTAQDEVVRICQDLLRIDTSNYGDNEGPGEREAAEYVMASLQEVGLDPELFESSPGRANVVVRLPGADPSREALVLHGHTDVVPAAAEEWSVDPFAGEERDGLLWGRGAVDMKDMDAMILAVVRQMAREGRRPARAVVLAMFADEEAGGRYGSHYAVDPASRALRGRHRGDQRGRRLLGADRRRARRQRWAPGLPAPDGGEGPRLAAPRRARAGGARLAGQPGQRRHAPRCGRRAASGPTRGRFG